MPFPRDEVEATVERYHELRETHSNVRAALEFALGDPVGSAVPAGVSGISAGVGSGLAGALDDKPADGGDPTDA